MLTTSLTDSSFALILTCDRFVRHCHSDGNTVASVTCCLANLKRQRRLAGITLPAVVVAEAESTRRIHVVELAVHKCSPVAD